MPGTYFPLLWGGQIEGSQTVTSYNFGKSISFYRNYMTADRGNAEAGNFEEWLVENEGYAPNTAKAYSYPLRPADLNIYELPQRTVSALADNPTGTVAWKWLQGFKRRSTDDVPRTIKCAFLVGWVKIQANEGNLNATNVFLDMGFAGTRNAANAMVTVGHNFNRHFDFVYRNGNLTDRFFRYFYGAG